MPEKFYDEAILFRCIGFKLQGALGFGRSEYLAIDVVFYHLHFYLDGPAYVGRYGCGYVPCQHGSVLAHGAGKIFNLGQRVVELFAIDNVSVVTAGCRE